MWANCGNGLDAEGESRILFRKFLWRSIFTERYDRTSATRALADYRELRSLLDRSSNQTPMLFDEKSYPLPDPEMLTRARWPNRKDRVSRGILAISLRSGGLDFADGTLASQERLSEREYHHLFPKGWLKKHGYSESEANLAINCALVTWKTNRALSDKSPSDYIQERVKKSSLGEAEIKRRVESHTIPYDHLMSDNYETFKEARTKQIHSIMIQLCNGESGVT